MGRDNVIVNRWFSQKERFADLMNGCLFQGQQVILPEQLEKIDRETDLFIPEKPGTEMIQGKGIQRYRDVAMRWEDRQALSGDHAGILLWLQTMGWKQGSSWNDFSERSRM